VLPKQEFGVLPKQEVGVVPEGLGADEPQPSFATKTETTNFLLPASVEQRMIELKSFSYPEGPEVPSGRRLLNPYLLANGAYYAGDWKVRVGLARGGR
jgi:hypothetical protein